MGYIKKNNAAFCLFINAFLWGSSYVWSKMLLGYLPRFSILFICSLGGFVSTMIMFFPYLRTIKKTDILPSMLVSCFSILSNTFCMLALQYTSSSNAAFIVQMSVVITPLIMAVLDRKMPQGKIIASTLIALAGLYLLTCDVRSFRLNTGDLFALGNALFFSLFIAALNINSKKVEPVHFTFIHHATNTLIFLFLAVAFEMHSINFHGLETPAFAMLMTASVLVSVITVLLQSAAIKFVRPEKATLIYTFEPVAAMVLAYIFIGEKINGIIPLIGCALILLSVVLSLYKPRRRRKKAKNETSVKFALE